MGLFDIFKRAKNDEQLIAYKPPKTAMRGLEAAQGGRLYSDWSTSSTLNEQLISGLETVRNRARDLEINNDYIRKYLNNLKVNVIGPQGVQLQCQFKDKSGALRKNINEKIESEFKSWSRKGFCEVTGRYSWPELQRMTIASTARDGEAFIRLIRTPGINPWSFSLQFINPASCPETLNARAKDGRRIRMGVEEDSWGRPIAYYFQARDKSDYTSNIAGKPYVRVPAKEVLHIFKSDRADAVRGLSWFSSSMLRLKMLSGMEDASLVAARVGASNMGFFTKKGSEDDARLRDDLEPDRKDDDLVTAAEPGMFAELPEGYDFKAFDPKVPQDSFAPFIKSMLRAVSSGLPAGSYNSIANDRESTSYSSLRHAWLDETDAYKELQAWFIDSFVRPVYQAWLETAYLSDRIKIPSSEFSDFLDPLFVPRRWGFIDPLKQTQADIESLQAGLKSKHEIIADNGRNYDDLAHELKTEQELEKALGLRQDESKAAAKEEV